MSCHEDDGTRIHDDQEIDGLESCEGCGEYLPKDQLNDTGLLKRILVCDECVEAYQLRRLSDDRKKSHLNDAT